ncbi:hypothetical protein [Actinokineospora pegani]|uniref:hypothetical protein n=1 Tax=Actinokineospora pegani TaxID=2654637 RepID=UPI0012EAFD16|nr:hypothetical protein [Actinokineospora pegani]
MNADLSGLDPDELLALSETGGGLTARLDAITGTARGQHGIAATVTLAGKLVALDLGQACTRMTAAELTAELREVIWRATDSTLAEGVEVLAPVVGQEITDELVRLTAREPGPAESTVEGESHDDFSEQTFALKD